MDIREQGLPIFIGLSVDNPLCALNPKPLKIGAASDDFARTVDVHLDGEDDVVALFLEFEDELHVGDFVGDAEINGHRGAEEVHGFKGIRIPRMDIFKI
jgi:hypothetical protein